MYQRPTARERYYTVVIPYVSKAYRTSWHPDTNAGPFAVLSRGAFKTQDEAMAWGKENLNGTPYSIVGVDV